MKKIVFDARMYGLEHAGIGRYVMNLLKNLKTENYAFHLLVKKKKLSEVKKDLGNNFEYHPSTSKHYSLKEQLEIIKILQRINPDLVHFPHFNVPVFYRKKYIVTIHDLIKNYFKGKDTTTKNPLFYWPKYLGYRLVVLNAIRTAETIIVPTVWWKRKIQEDYRISKNKIFVTHEGVDATLTKYDKIPKKKTEKIVASYHLAPGSFFIYTGSVYPHKNLERLIEAFAKLDGRNLTLAIVCSRSVFTERLKSNKKIRLLGFVPDYDLVGLYKNAVALVQPSLMEGFGLPGLEAMAVGCPVVSSSTSCLPEVYGGAALYFDPLDTQDIKNKLEMILKSKTLRKELITKGRKQVKKFSWQKTATKTLKIYEMATGD